MKVNRDHEVKGLYVHVPFCNHMCSYCDFPKMLYYSHFADQYLVTLEQDLANDITNYDSIYIGGGTPTSLSVGQFQTLLSLVSKDRKNDLKREFCVEVNPESCDNDKIKLMRHYGVNRVSIGVQTTISHYLKFLERYHNKEDVIRVIHQLIEQGISNISCDLIYGLPGQTLQDLDIDIDFLLSLPITHLSLYPLTIEKNTSLHLRHVKEVADEQLDDFYQHIVIRLKKAGFHRYEVSNFARSGFESKHNLLYWQNKCYRGVGPGASGYEKGIRYYNSRNLSVYFQGNRIRKEESVTDKDYLFEYIMLHLRTLKGINLQHFYQTFHIDFLKHFEQPIKKLLKQGLIILSDNSLSIHEDYLFIEHAITSEFLQAL